jgi:hypothetical protein
MGDSDETFVDLQNGRSDEQIILDDHIFGSSSLSLDYGKTIPWILNHIDCVVNQSRGNESIKQVNLCPHAVDGYGNDAWDKVGQAVGNLQAFRKLHISSHTPDYSHDDYYYDSDGDYVPVVPRGPIPDWEILARILKHVRQNVEVVINDERLRTMEEVQPFARAIHGHSFITNLQDRGMFPYESLDTLFSTLATLPALELITLGAPEVRQADESTLANPESLTELLRVPSLRSVGFHRFHFTRALCQAAANALMEGTTVTKLDFYSCLFPAEESAAILANGFSRNTSVISIDVTSPWDEALNGALGAALPSNSTLQELDFALRYDSIPNIHVDWPPIFLALRENTGLKSLKVAVCESMDESLCTAMQNGLGINKTLESLDLNDIFLRENNSDLWCRAFSFLRTNKALKSLAIDVSYRTKESCVSAFCINIAAMLQENTSLERLSIQRCNDCMNIKTENYFLIVTALRHNTTLKSLNFDRTNKIRLNDDEDKQIASLLKKSYALESLPDIDPVGNVSAMLRLNGAGRRYLVQDGSSISKGVQVLSRVNDDINCVFLHLLENPRLCDRSAVEMVTVAGETSDGSSSTDLNASSVEGKREQASAHKGNDSRRRLT